MQFCLASSLILTAGLCLQFLETECVRYHACAYHMTPYDLLKFGLNWNLQKAVRSHALQFWTMTTSMGKILEQTPRKMNCSNVNRTELVQEWSLVECSFPSPLDLKKQHIPSTGSTLDPFLGHPLFCPIDNFDRCLGQKYLIDRSTSAKHGATREHKKKRIGPHLPKKRRININSWNHKRNKILVHLLVTFECWIFLEHFPEDSRWNSAPCKLCLRNWRVASSLSKSQTSQSRKVFLMLRPTLTAIHATKYGVLPIL